MRETDRNVTRLLQKLLELADPWRVVKEELKDDDRSVAIEVESPSRRLATSTGGLARSTTIPRCAGGGIWTR